MIIGYKGKEIDRGELNRLINWVGGEGHCRIYNDNGNRLGTLLWNTDHVSPHYRLQANPTMGNTQFFTLLDIDQAIDYIVNYQE